MASSGSFNTTSYSTDYGKAYLTFSWSIESQDPATNKTVINWSLKGAGLDSGHYIKAGGFKVVINGQTVYSKDTSYRIELYTGTVVASGTATITHNADGTKTFSASAEAGIYYYDVNCSGSGSWALTTIPRYATSTQSLNKKTETTIKMNWESDSTVDYIWYSTDNGSNWTGVNVTDGTSGTYTISGLTANTTYKIKTRVRRKDSQLTTDSTALSVTTYNYPYCTSSPNFVLGDALTLSFYNPLKRAFKFYIIANGTQIDVEYNCSSTSYTGVNSAVTSVPYLYATIPNAQSGKYKVKVVYGNSTITRDNENTYSIKTLECYADFGNSCFTYKDTNTTVTAVTGSDQIIVKGLSTISVEIPVANKMVPKNSATAKNYVASIDTLSKTIAYSGTTAVSGVLGTVTSAGTKRLKVIAYDSRDLGTLGYKDITVYDYNKPVVNVDVKRLNNYEDETTIKISGSYSKLTIGGTDKNQIQSVQYRYRETDGSWSSWVTLTTTLSSGKYTCNNVVLSLDNNKSFEFEVKAVDKLATNTVSATVDIGQATFFISTNKKKCYINGAEVPTFDNVYPIGSVFCNSTNTNPSEIYGGTWELIDKGFKSGTTESTQDATDYLSKFNVTSIRGGNTIRLRINVTTAVDIGDTTVSLGTVDLAAHGLTKDDTGFFPYTVYGGVAMSDGGNAVILVYFTANGVLQTADAFQSDGTHTLPSGKPFYFDVVLPVTPSQMLDDFCDKFYFKRIA